MEDTKQQIVSWPTRGKPGASALYADDWVQVRSPEEILATLDKNGQLDGMPFMPEMLSFCGKTLRVFKRAHKACDTISDSGARKLERTVHLLESRCDGSAHGGCQAQCSLYWNEAWLKPAAAPGGDERMARLAPCASGCSEEQLTAATQQGHDAEKGPRYVCQITELVKASQLMSPYDPRQYIEDYLSGNVGLYTMLRGFMYRVGVFVIRRAGLLGRRIGLGDVLAKAVTAYYDWVQKLLPGGVPFPRLRGTIPKGQPTPEIGIGQIRPGSRVRVKPYHEILATLNTDNRTRGLYFDGEHVPYCGKEFTVRSLVEKIVDERTGYMLHFKSPSIILQNVYCQGTFSDNRMFCPRAILHYWRPVWLTPVEAESARADLPGEG